MGFKKAIPRSIPNIRFFVTTLTSTLMIMLFSTVTAFTRSFLDPSLDSYRRTYRFLLLFHSTGSSSDFLSLGPGWEDTREEKDHDFRSEKRKLDNLILFPHFTDEDMEVGRSKTSKVQQQVRDLWSLDSSSSVSPSLLTAFVTQHWNLLRSYSLG